jgi:hypothetical protein
MARERTRPVAPLPHACFTKGDGPATATVTSWLGEGRYNGTIAVACEQLTDEEGEKIAQVIFRFI